MTNKPQKFELNEEQRQQLIEEMSTLMKQRVLLQQALRKQQEDVTTANEEIFLELLEVLDSLEFLVNYMKENLESVPKSWAYLPKSLGSIENKLLTILAKRKVSPIDLQETQPDFNLCKVVDQEVRNDLENQTITKVIRKGFCLENKVLRPVEVITSKKES